MSLHIAVTTTGISKQKIQWGLLDIGNWYRILELAGHVPEERNKKYLKHFDGEYRGNV
jgi:hypothetical protein